MKNNNTHIDDALLIRVLSGEASEAEKVEYNNWIQADAKNQEIAEKLKATIDLLKKAKSTSRHEYNWKRIKQKIHEGYEVPSYISVSQEDPKTISIGIRKWYQVAAVLTLLIGLGILFKTIVLKHESYEIVAVEGQYDIPGQLPDGSEVYLNQGARIVYKKSFNRKTREVTLYGEAYFDVVPNEDKSFIIHSSNTTTRVLGTRFNIHTDSLLKVVEVSVTEGRVEFYPDKNGMNRVQLGQGEQGVYNYATNKLCKDKILDKNFISWKTGVLEFDNAPIVHVFRSIEKHYNVKIISRDLELEDLNLTSKYSNQTLKEVFTELNLLMGIDYAISNDTIYIK